MANIQIGDKVIREESITYIHLTQDSYEDWSRRDPGDFYNERIPRVAYDVALIHFIGGGPPLKISGERGLAAVTEYLRANPAKRLA